MSQRSIAIRSDSISRAGFAGKPRVLLLTPGGRTDSGESALAGRLAANLRQDGWSAAVDSGGVLSQLDSEPTLILRRHIGVVRRLRELVSGISGHDIVHVIALSGPAFWTFVVPMLVLARFFAKRTLLTYEPPTLEHFLERWFWLARPFIRLASRVQAENLHVATIYDRSGLDTEVSAFPVNGMAVIEDRSSRLQPKILLDSDLISENNPFCLLRAFKILKQKYPRAELVVARDGILRQPMRDFVERERIYGVTFCAPDSSEGLDQLYRETDLFVSASSLLHRPQTILRAFMAGLAVVLTDAEAVPELVIDRVNGLVVPINDHDAMASRLIELVENSQLVEQLTSHARQDALQYRWEKLGSTWRHLYRNLTASK